MKALCPLEAHFRILRSGQTSPEGERIKKNIPGKWIQEASWCGHFSIRENRLQTKIRRESEGQYRLIKGTIHQEDPEILNICVPNAGAPESGEGTGRQLAVKCDFRCATFRCIICYIIWTICLMM